RRSCIHAEFRDHPIVRFQIRRGKTEHASAHRSMFDDAFDTVRTPKHPPSKIHAAFAQKLSDRRRTHPRSAKRDLIDLIGKKSVPFAHASQKFDVTLASFAECKAFAEINLFC